MQAIKREKESNIGVKSNKTKGDYYDEEDTDAGSGYGYEEYGVDYGYGSYYDENNSANEHLGMFRSAHKGNHLPSIIPCLPCPVFKPLAFSRILSKGVPRSRRDG